MNEQLTLSLVTPAVLDVVYRDPQSPERIIITHRAASDKDVTYSDWTAGTYTRRDYRGNPIKNDNNPKGQNPYGVLPAHLPCFSDFTEELHPYYYFDFGGHVTREGNRELVNLLINKVIDK